MISEHFCGVDTVPALSVRGDPDGKEALALGCRVEWTPCNYGGRRPWLVCPWCSRRRLELFRPALWCRECLRLGYWSRRVNWIERRRWKAEQIRERLGGTPDLSRPFPRRPRGMHRRTFTKLCQEGRALEKLLAEVDRVLFELECVRGVRGCSHERRVYWDWLEQVQMTTTRQRETIDRKL